MAPALLDHRAFAAYRADIGVINQVWLQEGRQRSSFGTGRERAATKEIAVASAHLDHRAFSAHWADIGLINQATLCVVHIDGVMFHELSQEVGRSPLA